MSAAEQAAAAPLGERAAVAPSTSAAPPAQLPKATILICATCNTKAAPPGPTPGEVFAFAVAGAVAAPASTMLAGDGEALAADIRVETVRCLAACSRSHTAAIRSPGAWTYLVGDLDPARDVAALVEGARLLATAADGLLPWRGRPEVLKRGLIARLPPIDSESGDAVPREMRGAAASSSASPI